MGRGEGAEGGRSVGSSDEIGFIETGGDAVAVGDHEVAYSQTIEFGDISVAVGAVGFQGEKEGAARLDERAAVGEQPGHLGFRIDNAVAAGVSAADYLSDVIYSVGHVG